MPITLKLSLFILCSFLIISFQDVEAKRFGGGKSLSSGPHSNTKATDDKSRPNNPSHSQKKSGFLGGLLGGLLAGTLLGALFFGGFSGFGFVDILLLVLLGIIAWVVFKKLRQRTTTSTESASTPESESTSNSLFQNYNNENKK